MFRVDSLVKHFGGVAALAGASLSFEPGKITGIVGPNGSGKTTLMNAISGMITLDQGGIHFHSGTRRTLAPHIIRALGVTRTFQHSRLFDQMTCSENLEVVLMNRSLFAAFSLSSLAASRSRAAEILSQLNMSDKADIKAVNLSYGQRKLLEIGRVIAVDADIVLFDEPFAGLFPEMVKHISKILVDLKEQGKTIILIEHNMELMRSIPDSLYVMDAGRVLAHGVPTEVLSRPDVIEAYLGA